MPRFSLCRVVPIAVLLLLTAAACRPHDPPQRLPKNLGTPDDPILPTVVREYDAGILSGRALPVRAPETVEEKDEEDADTGGVGDEDADTSGADDAGADLAVADEDRELIEEIFDLGIKTLAEERLADLVHLIVPNQQQTLGKLFDQLGELGKASSRFNAVVLEKAPEMAAAMAGMIQMPGMPAGMPGAQGGPPTPEQLAELFKISELRMTADDQAVATIDMMGQRFPVELWLVDDDWYIHLPELLEDQEIIDGLAMAGQLITEKVDEIATRLEDGSLAPEALMPELMKIGQELMPVITELAPKFQAPAAQIEPEPEEAGEAAEAPVTGDVPDDVREAIEALLAKYDDAEAEKRFNDLVELYVPDQRQAAGEALEQVGALIEAMEGFATTVDEKAAGAGAPLKQQLEADIAARQTISELRSVAPDRYAATITESGEQKPYEFRRVDNQWFLWSPDLADAAKKEKLVSLFSSTAEKIETLAEQLDSDEVAPNMAMMSFQGIKMEFVAGMRKLKGEESGTDQPPSGRGRGHGRSGGVG